MNIFSDLILIVLTPLLGSISIYLFARRASPFVIGLLTFLVCLITLILSVVLLVSPPAQKFDNLFLSDDLSLLVLIASTAVSAAAVFYSIGYFKNQADFDARGFYSLVLLFLAGITGVILSSNLILFYVFWETMLLPTYAMVAFFGEDKHRSSAIGLKYFIFTHIGAVLILFGILILYSQTGSADIIALKSLLLSVDPFILKTVAMLFILGFAVKMAIWPLHSWLPETYTNAPIPATILLSAVMMNAPIYGLLRFFFTMLPRSAISPFVLFILVSAIISQFYGAILAMVEKNIKRMIAYSSVSQMGYVLFGIGTLTFLGVSGATFHIINHAIIKALLFMSVGAVFYATKEYNTDRLGGLALSMPVISLASAVGALAIAGVPLFGAFQSEWLIFAGGFKTVYPILAGIAVLGVVFTAAYALRFIADIFFGPAKVMPLHKIPVEIVASMIVLAASTLIIGVYPYPFSSFVQMAVKMLGI